MLSGGGDRDGDDIDGRPDHVVHWQGEPWVYQFGWTSDPSWAGSGPGSFYKNKIQTKLVYL